jgi:hypothetical protein
MTDYRRTADLIANHLGIRPVYWAGMNGQAPHGTNIVYVPRPTNHATFTTFLHEVAHHELGHTTDRTHLPHDQREREADEYAQTWAARFLT